MLRLLRNTHLPCGEITKAIVLWNDRFFVLRGFGLLRRYVPCKSVQHVASQVFHLLGRHGMCCLIFLEQVVKIQMFPCSVCLGQLSHSFA